MLLICIGRQFSIELSLFFLSCKQRHWLPLFQIHFKDMCTKNDLGYKDVFSQSNGQAWLLSSIKDSDFLNSEFFTYYITQCMCRCYLTLFCVVLWEPELREPVQMSWAMVPVIAVSNKLSFVSDPGVSWLLPVLTKRWQANLQVCKHGNISDLHSSPQYNPSLLSVKLDLLVLSIHKPC